MVAASPNAGLIYICNPNNPTGTLTSRADIEWVVANKPQGAIVLIDEAYLHISPQRRRLAPTWSRRTKTSSSCAPSRSSMAWPVCAPAPPSPVRICWTR